MGIAPRSGYRVTVGRAWIWFHYRGGLTYELCALSVDNPLEPFIPLLSLSIWWNVNKMNKVGKQGKKEKGRRTGNEVCMAIYIIGVFRVQVSDG